MVRETRHLWVGNLPDNIREERIREHFKRYGRVQSVKLLPRSAGGGAKEEAGEGAMACTVAFMDIKSASKARDAEHKIDDRTLTTEYYEPVAIPSAASPQTPSNVYVTSPGSTRFPNGHGPTDDHGNFSDRFYDRTGGRVPETDYIRAGGRPGGGGVYHETNNRGRNRDRPTYARNGPYNIIDRSHRLSNSSWSSSYDSSSTTTTGSTTTRYSNQNSDTGYSTAPSETNERRTDSISTKKKTKSRSGTRSPSPSGSTSSRSASRSRSRSSSSSSSSSTSRGSSSTSSPRSRRQQGNAQYQEDRRPLAICVKNLPCRSSDTSLKDGLFHEYKKHGKVTSVKVVGQSAERHAIVCFKKPEDVEKALEVSYDKLFFGSKIEVVPYQGHEVDESDSRLFEAEIDEYNPKATRTLFIGNLEKDVTQSELRKHFDQFGKIFEIDIKKQGAVSSYAFCQYSDIVSVVKAIRALDGEHLGNNRIKLGFGKSMPTSCVWVDGVTENVSEKYLMNQFEAFGSIQQVSIDRERGQSLVFYEQVSHAQAAVNKMRGATLGRNRKIQVDFASRECQDAFFDHLEKQGHVADRITFEERRDSTSRTFEAATTAARFSRYDTPTRPRTSSYSNRSTTSVNQLNLTAISSPGTPGSVTPRGSSSRSRVSRYPQDYYEQNAEYGERHFRNYDEYSQGSGASQDEPYEHEYNYHESPSQLEPVDRLQATVADHPATFPLPDIRNLQKERVHILEQLDDCSSGDEIISPKKKIKLDHLDSPMNCDVIIEANRDHRKVMEVRRLSDTSTKHHSRRPSVDGSKHRDLTGHDRNSYMPHAICKRRKTGGSDNGSRVHHYDQSGPESVGGSRPGTPLCDEKPEHLPTEPRRTPRDREGPLSLPLPRFATQILHKGSISVAGIKGQKDNILSSPPAAVTSPRIVSNPKPPSPVHVPPPASPPPRPPSLSSSSSDSDGAPPSPSLDERIRSLDEKYEKWSGSRALSAAGGDALAKLDANRDKFKIRHKLLDPNLDLKVLQPSEIVKSVMAKRSVFDEDSKRLENVGEKYEPREFSAFPKAPPQPSSVPANPLATSTILKISTTQLSKTPTILSPRSTSSGITPAKGLQYPFPSHPPVLQPLMAPTPPAPALLAGGATPAAVTTASPTCTTIAPRAPHGDNRLKPCTASGSASGGNGAAANYDNSETRTPSKVSSAVIVNRTVVTNSAKTSDIGNSGSSTTKCSIPTASQCGGGDAAASTDKPTKGATAKRRDSTASTDSQTAKSRRNSECGLRRSNDDENGRSTDNCDSENERLEKERIEREQRELAEKLERERLQREKEERERREREEKERREREEKERRDREERERKEREERERKERERREKEEREREEKERIEREERERKEREEKERRELEEQFERERLEKEKERQERERIERERQEKERLEKEKLEKERLEKERLEKEKLEAERLQKEKERQEKEKERKREKDEERNKYKEDNHDNKYNKHTRENHSEKSHEARKEHDSRNHESREQKSNKHHSERDSERRKENSKENRENNSYEKSKNNNEIRDKDRPSLETRHLSIDLDKNRQNDSKTDPNRRKERNNSLPAHVGSKRRLSAHDNHDDSESKKIKLNQQEHKKITERRSSKDSNREEKNKKYKLSKSSHEEKRDKHNNIREEDKQRKEKDREHKKKSEKQKSKSKDKQRDKETPSTPSTPGKDISMEKDFLSRLELKESQKQRKEKRKQDEEERKDEKRPESERSKDKFLPLIERKSEDNNTKSEERKVKKERIRKVTNSSDNSDSDEPKKHSIFDIVDDEPAYISMYDKVKARSCKNMQKQEEEKRQEKIKAKFSQLKQSRAKREEKKRSTSWDEDSDSDRERNEMKEIKRKGKMLIQSSDEEDSSRNVHKKNIYSDSDSERNQMKNFDTSDDDHMKNSQRKGSKSRITSDTSDDEFKNITIIKNEIFSDNDEQYDFFKKEPEDKYSKKNKTSKIELSNDINVQIFGEASSAEENERKEKLEIRKKHKKKQKKQRNFLSDESVKDESNEYDKIKNEKKKQHSKKDKKRDKSKDEVREKSKKSKKAKENKRDGKMENIFGSLSDDSENGKEDHKPPPFISRVSEETAPYTSDSDGLTVMNENMFKSEERERNLKEEHRKRKEKKRREKEKQRRREEASINENSIDFSDLGKQLEDNIKDDSNDVPSIEMKNEIKVEPPSDFKYEGEQEYKKEERKENKEKKKKRKKSKDEKQRHHHHHHHHHDKIKKQPTFPEFKKEVNKAQSSSPLPSLQEEKAEVAIPVKTEVEPSLPNILEIPSPPQNKPSPNIDTSSSPVRCDAIITPTPAAVPIPSVNKEKKRDKFIPGFGTEIDEKIHETAVKSISEYEHPKIEKVMEIGEVIKEEEKVENNDEKPRVVISQEETEDAVAALLGESFGSGQFDDYNEQPLSPINPPTIPDDNQDDEEMRQAVQSLHTTELDIKPDTPQSENDLQIDTDTEDQEDISLRFDQLPKSSEGTESTHPPKTPEIPSYYKSSEEQHKIGNNNKALTTTVNSSSNSATIPNIGSPPSLTPIKPPPQLDVSTKKVVGASLPLLPEQRTVISQNWEQEKKEVKETEKQGQIPPISSSSVKAISPVTLASMPVLKVTESVTPSEIPKRYDDKPLPPEPLVIQTNVTASPPIKLSPGGPHIPHVSFIPKQDFAKIRLPITQGQIQKPLQTTTLVLPKSHVVQPRLAYPPTRHIGFIQSPPKMVFQRPPMFPSYRLSLDNSETKKSEAPSNVFQVRYANPPQQPLHIEQTPISSDIQLSPSRPIPSQFPTISKPLSMQPPSIIVSSKPNEINIAKPYMPVIQETPKVMTPMTPPQVQEMRSPTIIQQAPPKEIIQEIRTEKESVGLLKVEERTSTPSPVIVVNKENKEIKEVKEMVEKEIIPVVVTPAAVPSLPLAIQKVTEELNMTLEKEKITEEKLEVKENNGDDDDEKHEVKLKKDSVTEETKEVITHNKFKEEILQEKVLSSNSVKEDKEINSSNQHSESLYLKVQPNPNFKLQITPNPKLQVTPNIQPQSTSNVKPEISSNLKPEVPLQSKQEIPNVKPEIQEETKTIVTKQPEIESLSVIKEIEKIEEEKDIKDTDSVVSDISKERLSAEILCKDDPLDSKEDSDYWSAKEVNIDSVIKKVDALCSADELSDRSSEIGKDDWFDDQKKTVPEKPEPVEPIERKSSPIVADPNDFIEDAQENPEEKEVVVRGGRRGGRSRGGRKTRGAADRGVGVQTRRGKGIAKDVTPAKRGGRGGRPKNERKVTKSESETNDIYEFRDDSDDSKDRPRLILTIKPIISNANGGNNPQPTAIVKEVSVKPIVVTPKAAESKEEFAPPISNTRKSKRLQEKDVFKNTIDDTIEDVVKNTPNILTRSASNLVTTRRSGRQATKAIAAETTPPKKTRAAKNKNRRGSETTDDSSEEKSQSKASVDTNDASGNKEIVQQQPPTASTVTEQPIKETKVDVPKPSQPEEVIEKDSSSNNVNKPKGKPIEGLKATVLRRIKGDMSQEPMSLIDPVTGLLTPMRECEENKYIPVSGNGTQTATQTNTTVVQTITTPNPIVVQKIEQPIVATQPSVLVKQKPQSLKAHVLSFQSANKMVVTQPVQPQKPSVVTPCSTTTPNFVPRSSPLPVTQNLNVNVTMPNYAPTHLSPRPSPKSIPGMTITTTPQLSPNQIMLQKQVQKPPMLNPIIQAPMNTAQIPTHIQQTVVKQMKQPPTIVKSQPQPSPQPMTLNKQLGKHGVHPQVMLPGSVPSSTYHNAINRVVQTTAKDGTKVEATMAVCATVPKVSAAGPQRHVLPTGMPVPGYEASLGEGMAGHFPPGSIQLRAHDLHYLHPSHVMYQQLLRHQYIPRSPMVAIEKRDIDGQEGEEAPVTSPPLELRRPGSVGLALNRTSVVPHSLQSPHDRTTDSPQIYGMHTARMQHYHPGNRIYDHEPPPAHRAVPHGAVTAFTNDRPYADRPLSTERPPMVGMVRPDRPLSNDRPFSGLPTSEPLMAHSVNHIGGLVADRPLPMHLPERSVNNHELGAGMVSGMNVSVLEGIARQAATPSTPANVEHRESHDNLFQLLKMLQHYPCMWQGLLALKNDQAAVQMYYVSGNDEVAKMSLPKNVDGSTPPLRIFQRMRLEPPQVEGVTRKMQAEKEHCMLLALPCGQTSEDVIEQTSLLRAGLIKYLTEKQAAGIINVAAPGTKQPPAYVVHIFPSCDFVNDNLRRVAPDLLERVSSIAHLLIIITTV